MSHSGFPAHRLHTYVVCKVNKHLGIYIFETGERVYSPPNFIHLHSRQPLIDLADAFNGAQVDPEWKMIDLIVAFETEHNPRAVHERREIARHGRVRPDRERIEAWSIE